MKKYYLLLLALFCMATFTVKAQHESGFLVGSGIGSMNKDFYQNKFVSSYSASYRFNLSLGYRYRAFTATPLFFDMDANLGVRQWHSEYVPNSYYSDAYYSMIIKDYTSNFYFLSVGGTANYSLYKGLSIGLGVEPTYYFKCTGEDSDNHFDVPLVGKVAYRFRPIEIGLSYKYGLMNVVKNENMKSGKFRDLQLSLWIPF